MGQNMPSIRLEALGGVVAEPADDLAVDGDAVVVVYQNEFAEFLHAGQ